MSLREPDCEWCQDSGMTASGGINETPRCCDHCPQGELTRQRHRRYNIIAVTILAVGFVVLWWAQWGKELAN